MYETAKKARNALKNKARSMAAGTSGKVDSSDWTPAEPLNANVKTGLRPISRRAYKSGGKVAGDCPPMRADRKPRKAGGKAVKAEAAEWARAKVNRNVKAANEEREGIKHIGALKTGGRAKHATDGRVKDHPYRSGGRTKKEEGGGVISSAVKRIKNWATNVPEGYGQKPEKNPRPVDTTPSVSAEDRGKMDALVKKYGTGEEGLKHGGKAKKAYGGASKGAQKMIDAAQEQAGVSPSRMSFQNTTSRLSKAAGLKKGGTAKHPDEAMDKALIKKMVKPSARMGKKEGGFLRTLADRVVGDLASDEAMKLKDKILGEEGIGSLVSGLAGGMKKGGKAKHSDEAIDKALIKKMVKPEARTARKSGGRTGKSKTNINIVIAGGKPQDGGAPMPPGGKPLGLPAGVPLPMMPPGGAPPMGAGAPPPMPPMAPPAGGPPTPPPGMMMGRKAGGRITKKASSYKDMEAGAGGGEGRLQKTDIAKRHAGAPTRATGGRTYRSYKDMDAGAGSGEGRLEKSEIQHSKRVR